MESSTTQNTNQVKQGNKSLITLIDGTIFFVLYDDDVLLELEDFQESRAAFDAWSEHEKLKILVEFPRHTAISAEARKSAENARLEAVAEAIVIHSLSLRMITRFYLLFQKNPHPVRVFTSFELALEWLKSVD